MSTITIHGYTFTVPSPYEIGHKCTAAEAQALNSKLHENLARNFRKRVREDQANGGGVSDLQAELDSYASSYSLNGTDPIESEAFVISLQIVKARLKAQGRNITDFSRADLNREAEKLLDARQNPLTYGDIIVMARERVEALQKAAKKEMERLNADA